MSECSTALLQIGEGAHIKHRLQILDEWAQMKNKYESNSVPATKAGVNETANRSRKHQAKNKQPDCHDFYGLLARLRQNPRGHLGRESNSCHDQDGLIGPPGFRAMRTVNCASSTLKVAE